MESFKNGFADIDIANNWDQISGDTGDKYRKLFINPLIAGLTKDISNAATNDIFLYHYSDAPLATFLSDYYSTLIESKDNAKQRQEIIGETQVALKEQIDIWRRTKKNPLALSVFDFGCGNGYRAKWLTDLGARYTGYDSSKQLLKVAKEKIKGLSSSKKEINNLPQATIQYCDLSSHDLPTVKTTLKSTFSLFITVFDHLDREAILRNLTNVKEQTSNQINSFIFVVTCNPYYYSVDSEFEEDSIDSSVLESMQEQGCDKKITFYRRTHKFYEKLFQSAELSVVDYICPSSPFEERGYKPDAFMRGVGPFNIWLLRANSIFLKAVKTESIATEFSLEENPMAKLMLDELIKSEYNEFRLLEVKKGFPIIEAGNLAGEIRLMVDGQANLGSSENLVFRRGDIIGDFEIPSPDAEPTYYRTTVWAKTDCTLLLVPSIEACKLFNQANFLGLAFKYLRKKAQAQLSIMTTSTLSPRSRTPKRNTDKSIIGNSFNILHDNRKSELFNRFKKNITRTLLKDTNSVANLLISAYEHQKDHKWHNCKSKNVIFLPKIKELSADLGSEVSTAMICRILVSVGAIYTCVGSSNNVLLNEVSRRFQGNEIYEQFYEKNIFETAEATVILIENEYYLRKIGNLVSTSVLSDFVDYIDSLSAIYTHYWYTKPNDTSINLFTLQQIASDYPKLPQFHHRLNFYNECTLEYLDMAIKNKIIQNSIGFNLCSS